MIGHKGGGTEKYINDIKEIFSEYKFSDFNIYDKNIDYNIYYNNLIEFDIIHINSILFNNLKDNYIYFFKNYFINSKKYITIHDYQWMYPDNPNILMEDFLINIPNSKDIKNFTELLAISSIIIFPSNNIYLNYKKYINFEKKGLNEKIHIVNHMDKIINHNLLFIPNIIDTINISFIGRFIKFKGSEFFKLLIKKYKFIEKYRIKYHIFGNIENANEHENENQDEIQNFFKENNVILHNEYNDNELIDNLHKYNIHGITHLSLFEESYCYALTNSINSGIPIFYISRGSISERLIEKYKYFSCTGENFLNMFELFLEYVIKNKNSNNFYKSSEILQPNRWYLTNY